MIAQLNWFVWNIEKYPAKARKRHKKSVKLKLSRICLVSGTNSTWIFSPLHSHWVVNYWIIEIDFIRTHIFLLLFKWKNSWHGWTSANFLRICCCCGFKIFKRQEIPSTLTKFSSRLWHKISHHSSTSISSRLSIILNLKNNFHRFLIVFARAD